MEAETLGFLLFGTRCVLLYWKGEIISGISYVTLSYTCLDAGLSGHGSV